MTEYAIMIAVVAVATAGLLALLGLRVAVLFESVAHF